MPRTDVVMRRLGLTKEKLIQWAKTELPHIVWEEQTWRLKDMEEFTATRTILSKPVLMKVLLTAWMKAHGIRKITPNWWRKKIGKVEDDLSSLEDMR